MLWGVPAIADNRHKGYYIPNRLQPFFQL
jgi:hypothetical protein